MYFVEDNAAEAPDSQVKDNAASHDELNRLLNVETVCPESSRGNRGGVFLLDL